MLCSHFTPSFFRHYNPEIGRFISADPLYVEEMDKRGVDTQELNIYAYVRNNPISYLDPTGESGVFFGAGGGGGSSISGQSTTFGAGVYVGVKPDAQGFAQIGGYVNETNTNIDGGKLGAGFTVGYYHGDVNDSLGGISRVQIDNFIFGSVETGYNKEGNAVYQAFSFGGEGFGFGSEKGTSETYLAPLSEHDSNLGQFNQHNTATHPTDDSNTRSEQLQNNPNSFD